MNNPCRSDALTQKSYTSTTGHTQKRSRQLHTYTHTMPSVQVSKFYPHRFDPDRQIALFDHPWALCKHMSHIHVHTCMLIRMPHIGATYWQQCTTTTTSIRRPLLPTRHRKPHVIQLSMGLCSGNTCVMCLLCIIIGLRTHTTQHQINPPIPSREPAPTLQAPQETRSHLPS